MLKQAEYYYHSEGISRESCSSYLDYYGQTNAGFPWVNVKYQIYK